MLRKPAPACSYNPTGGESHLSQGCASLSLCVHTTRSGYTQGRSWRSSGWEMSQEASRWPQGSPGAGLQSRYQ